MRIAVLSDLHGNLLALDACLADLESQGGAEAIVVAGDLCLDGPKPKKVLQRLEEIGAACVRGNKDRYLYDDSATEKLSSGEIGSGRRGRGAIWASGGSGGCANCPSRCASAKTKISCLIVHANPLNDDEHLWPDADDATLTRLVGDERATAIAFGHLHLPYVRIWKGRMLVNVASAGLPKDGDPRACYAIFTERDGGWQVKHRRVAFDVKRVATQLADSGIPESADLIATLRRHRYKRLKSIIP